MEDFPIWLRLIVYGMVGLTVVYAGWGIVYSILSP